jgi:hypothetical protein
MEWHNILTLLSMVTLNLNLSIDIFVWDGHKNGTFLPNLYTIV